MAFPQTPSPSAGPQGTGRIRGRVIAADTGAPLRGARIGVSSGDAQPPRDTVTDSDGRYEVGQLPPGAFFVSAAQDGYLSAVYGQRRLRLMEPGTAVTVGAGQTVERIDLALPRAGAIVVRLTDESGQPLAGARVDIQRFQYAVGGQRRLTSVPDRNTGTGHDGRSRRAPRIRIDARRIRRPDHASDHSTRRCGNRER